MNEVSLQIVGCGDAFAAGGRFNTCFHVKAPSLEILIDCGVSSLVALKKYNIDTAGIDVIVISHLHGDHFGGLPLFILDASLSARRTKPLTIIGPDGCQQKVAQLMELLYPGFSPQPGNFNIEYITFKPGRTFTMDSFSLQVFPVIHAAETKPHALRCFIGNKIIAYSGDTEWTDVLPLVARQADLFICECSYFNTETKGHLDYYKLKQHIETFDCRRILLTHLGDEMLQNIAGVQMECAEEGKRYIIG
jgi:ribonuclease BN (tRNA processing enzyme)